MKNILKYSLLIVLLIFTSCNNKKQVSNQDEKEIKDRVEDIISNAYSAKIDSLIQTTSPRIFNGVILITQNGETKYSKAYGYSDFEHKTPISINDNFRIQSNSKQVTAVLILKEMENGNINLQQPFRKYLPEFTEPWADQVTVHQLLNMSSGIDGLKKPLLFEPGTDYKYSNPAYGLLGRILERVTNKRYVELANAMFEDLGMEHSYCYEIGKENPKLISGYRVDNNEMNLVNFNALGISQDEWIDFIPAGGIISNLKDLNIWDTKLHTGKLLNPKTYELMVDCNIFGQHDAFGKLKIGYGYGVRVDDKQAFRHVGHAGRGLGFASIKFYVPDENLDVIVLENVYNEDVSIIYHFEKEIRKIVLDCLDY